MMKGIMTGLLLCVVLAGCRHPREVIEITCQPGFEYEPRPEYIVTTRDGDQRDASDQFLIIASGSKRYRIPWGTPPVSYGPLALSQYETYTFTLDQHGRSVRSIRQGDKLVYQAE